MTFHSYRNTVTRPPQKNYWDERYYGLGFSRDPRDRCTLVIGDGFTRSFLNSQSIPNIYSCSIEGHFREKENLLYVPVEGDRFEKGVLWEQNKWPRLFELWSDFGVDDPREFYDSIAKAYINPDKSIGAITYSTASVGFELRCYLWHLFRSQHYYLFREGVKYNVSNWEWYEPLRILMSEYALGVANFNYDLIAEHIIGGLNHAVNIVAHELGGVDRYKHRPCDSIALYKLHGAISYYYETGQGSCANPWLVDARYSRNQVVNPHLNIDVDMRNFPEFPDIVPPGHYGADKIVPDSNVSVLCKDHISNSSLVIFCGLSAEEPDTAEVRDLIQQISSESRVIHVGLENDKSGVLAALLQQQKCNYQFMLPEQLKSFSVIKRDGGIE